MTAWAGAFPHRVDGQGDDTGRPGDTRTAEPAAALDGEALLRALRVWAEASGFSQIGVSDVDLSRAEAGLLAWLHNGCHGEMDYMARHGLVRARPAELVPGTLRVITARMDYLPRDTPDDWREREWQRLGAAEQATVSLYARGRDYHKVLRQRLQRLADQLAAAVGPFGHRVFTDSAPVLEVELAQRGGLGWRGKHTLLIERGAGSMFFLGELFVDIPLPVTPPTEAHCGRCSACLSACPTGAIVAPYRLDARRCISYLTIEHDGPIPLELRPLLGNRIYGCDDCQLACPWNKFAQPAVLADFDARPHWPGARLAGLWAWDEATFLQRIEGSPIRRIGFTRWRRNLAVALGNALRSPGLGEADAQALRQALLAAPEWQQWSMGEGGAAGVPGAARADHSMDRVTEAATLVAEHIGWALAQRPG